jgi:hypothetical protein
MNIVYAIIWANCPVSSQFLNIDNSMVAWLIISYFQEIYEYTSEDLVDLGEIGRGNFGCVNQMLHRQSQTKMAVKVFI